jgi:hypothetical protein
MSLKSQRDLKLWSQRETLFFVRKVASLAEFVPNCEIGLMLV